MRTVGAILGFLALSWVSAGGHQELYHNVDVDLTGTAKSGVVEVSFTVHAPELLVGFGEAADAMYDDRWLRERSDEELERIVKLARAFLGERFALRFDGMPVVDLGAGIVFEDFERMRGAGADELPPACLLARIELAVPGETGELRVDHAADSQKRLMLVVYRPKAFPEVIDVEAGGSGAVGLPELEAERGGAIYAIIVGLMIAAMVVLQMRRGVRLARRMDS